MKLNLLVMEEYVNKKRFIENCVIIQTWSTFFLFNVLYVMLGVIQKMQLVS